jgi:CRP-like cAMP-binding protein
LWLEPLPAIELASRIRHMHLFEYASIDELLRIAALGRQVRHEPGRTLYEAGAKAETLQFLLDGRVTLAAEDGTASERQAPAALAVDAVLEGSPMGATVRAADTAITLLLTTEEFLSLLSENVEIAQGIFRMLIDTTAAAQWRLVLPGKLTRALERKVDTGLQPMDRVLLLQSSPLLARASATQLLALAQIARPVTLAPGSDPVSGVEPSILVVLSGGIRLEREGQAAETAGPGDTVGIYETLGGVPPTARAEVLQAGHGLRFIRSELFDLLADNVDLLQGIFSGLLRQDTFHTSVTTRV